MDKFFSTRMMWNWNTEEAPQDGLRFLAYVPGAKAGNRVQRVRCRFGLDDLLPSFFNDHGNEVYIEAFFAWSDPAEERRILDAFSIDDPDGYELAELLDEHVSREEITDANQGAVESFVEFLKTPLAFIGGLVIGVTATSILMSIF